METETLLDKVFRWVLQGYTKFLLAYAASFAVAYLVLWLLLEPLGLAEQIRLGSDFIIGRVWLHLIMAAIVGCHICLFALLKAIYAQDGILRPPADNVYTPASSLRFYDSIALGYDDRNSASLNATHEQVIALIQAFVRKEKTANVLDLGGGTGKLIAHRFGRERSISWHYVDNSAEMLKRFSDNLDDSHIDITTDLKDIHRFLQDKSSDPYFRESFDIVLICLTLTSLKTNPNWSQVTEMLRIGGRLIIADIDAAYTSKNPYYTISQGGVKHALRPRAVPFTSILNEIAGEHLDFDHSYPVKQGERDYAFVAEFIKS